MFPGIFLCSFSSDGKRSHVTPNSQSSIVRSSPSPEYQRPIFSHVKKKQKGSGVVLDDIEADDGYNSSNYSLHFDRDPSRFSLRSYNLHCRNREDVKATNKKRDMSAKVSNFSDLIQRVAASCLLHPLAGVKHDQSVNDGSGSEEEDVFRYETEDEEEETEEEETDEEEVEELERKKSGEIRAWKQGRKKNQQQSEEAHCPWDPDQMRVADVAVVGELRNLGVLRERFRRCVIVGDGGRRRKSGYGVGMLREAVAPYEAAVDELKKEVKTKEAEVQNLKEKLKAATCTGKGGKKKGFSSQSKRKVSCSHGSQGNDEPGERDVQGVHVDPPISDASRALGHSSGSTINRGSRRCEHRRKRHNDQRDRLHGCDSPREVRSGIRHESHGPCGTARNPADLPFREILHQEVPGDRAPKDGGIAVRQLGAEAAGGGGESSEEPILRRLFRIG
ncbi:Protein GRAVITROPIC IN THE LIGHT 1 [Linum perenne]